MKVANLIIGTSLELNIISQNLIRKIEPEQKIKVHETDRFMHLPFEQNPNLFPGFKQSSLAFL
ncbi:hypothetical protein GCM10010230_68270 [Streptomyces narbonensis]|nr:hypothetical protein GCM10010230_68270 [Streptomyces narbonensis]